MPSRKLQRTGGGTFFVCLPKTWADRLCLKCEPFVSVAASLGRIYDWSVDIADLVMPTIPSA